MVSSRIGEIAGVVDIDHFETWREILDYKQQKQFVDYQWVFRGQSDAKWCIKSTFERAREGREQLHAWKYEAAMLREFKRRAHHYTSDLPTSDDVLEWFALMRHYGAPCRLVDFTYSFYIAAYLTLTKMSPKKGPGAIWAVNEQFLKERYEKRYEVKKGEDPDFRFENPKVFYDNFLDHQEPMSFAIPVNPFRLNERLTAQQGLFLCPGNIDDTFMNNLLGESPETSESNIVRIVIKPSMRKEAIPHLRSMNITSATLFPDLIGFAQSLCDWFDIPFHYEDEVLDETLKGEDYRRHPYLKR